ncbi:hypothetical protein VFPPC_13040 [Pochonia chlamydosporia 170]|uniref:Uncharacterized protein n=1 Tax=Pochonia chlamydosporia 170 TaxID=1380566 RepID=A0A179G746_METCM|nr:hypothetical protein VFPPC_13040 [Pochonia chlamydosporia 170]OAQ73616.1 hypothetical protein VFPPC_13040 [Pochonia chlamydosporia 170]
MYPDYKEVWLIAACVLLFLTAFPALVIFFCSLCVVRRKADPSRRWLVWFRAGFIMFALSNFLLFVVYLFAVIFSDLYQPQYDTITSTTILPVQVELDLISSLLGNFAEICMILALSGLDKGIIVAHKTETRRGDGDVLAGTVELLDKVFHFSVYGLAGVLAVLSIAAFGLGQHLYSMYGLSRSRIGYDHSFVGLSFAYTSLGNTSKLLSLAMHIMVLAIVLFITIKSIATKVRCRGDKRVKLASTYLIVCDALFLLRAAYSVSYAIAFAPSSNTPPSVFTVVDVVADTWPAFVIFCILFALGSKKRGLWSTMQPSTPGLLDITPQQTPRSYSHNTSQPSDVDLESNAQEPQMHEMLQVTSHEQQIQEPMPRHSIPRRPVNPPQIQTQQQQIRETLAAEGDDDSPPDYYTARYQAPPQQSPQQASPLQPVVDDGQVQAGPSFALPAQQPYDGMAMSIPGSPPPHADAMGLYHQADGRMPESQPLPYNEKN